MAADVTDASHTTLLLVDDDADVLTGLRRALSRDCYRIIETSNALDAIDVLSTTDVDVIIAHDVVIFVAEQFLGRERLRDQLRPDSS